MTAGRGKSVSIIDVAKAAGVSQQTVSRVANGSEKVRESTRRKVHAAMKELGYTPNRQARALRIGRSKMIGLAVRYYRNNALGDLLEGMSAVTARLGYSIIIIPVADDVSATLQRDAEYVQSLNLDGLVVFSDDDIPKEAADAIGRIPAVVLGALQSFPPEWSFVDMQESRISELAVEHLLDLGHRTVWHVSGPLSFPAAQTRVNAWCKALEDHGAPVPDYVQADDWMPDDGFRAADKLLDRYPDCTAIYASDDAIANGVIAACRSRGLAVGRDVSVVGVDDVLGDFVPNNVLTSVKRDYIKAGAVTVELLMNMIKDHESGAHRAAVPPQLVVRSSTCAIA